MKKNIEACLVCGAPLVYFSDARPMECAVCHKTFSSNAMCENGHFVCDKCHGKAAIAAIEYACNQIENTNPVEIAQSLMDLPGMHMHGPEHHVLVGSALLTAYHTANGSRERLKKDLLTMAMRGSSAPGGMCGFWGCCGAAVSVGMFFSIVTESNPLSRETWGMANKATGLCLQKIGEIGGPRCCKRDSLTAIKTAAELIESGLGVALDMPDKIVCRHFKGNKECLGRRCPYFPAYAGGEK